MGKGLTKSEQVLNRIWSK